MRRLSSGEHSAEWGKPEPTIWRLKKAFSPQIGDDNELRTLES